MFDKRIRELRQQKGWSCWELAKRCGLTDTAVRYIDSGKRHNPQAESVLRIARALGTTVEDLYSEQEVRA